MTSGLMLVGLRLSGQGFEFVAVALLARRLGPGAFGAFAIGLLAARYGGIIGDWGASVRGVRDVARGESADALRALQMRRTAVSLGLAALYLISALALFPEVGPLAIVLIARGINRDWLSLGRGRHARAGLPAAVQGVLTLGAGLFANSVLEACALVGGAYATGLLLSSILNRLPPASPDWRGVRTDPWLLIATIADQVVATGDTFLVGALLSTDKAGVYAAVYRLPNALQTVAGLIALAGVPAAARLVSRTPEALEAARRRLLRRAMVPALVAAASAPAAGLLVTPLFGGAYASGRIPAVLLVLAAAINVAATPLHPLYLALGNDRSQARLVSTAAAAGIAGDVMVLAFGGGLTGVAAVALAVQIFLFTGFLRGTKTSRHP